MARFGIAKQEPPVPFTIHWLKALKPGERFVFYRGKFSNDIERSAPHSGNTGNKRDRGASNYLRLLRSIEDTARELEKDGKIVIDVRVEKTDNGAEYFEYTAIGKSIDVAPSLQKKWST